MLIGGSFAPLIAIEVEGSISFPYTKSCNCFDSGIQGGIVLIGVALVGLYATLTRRYKYLWGSGLVSVLLLKTIVFRLDDMSFIDRFREMKGAWEPYLNLPYLVLHGRPEWGLGVMGLGCILILTAAVMDTWTSILERLQKSRSSSALKK
jgi:hypothetical protein